MNEKEIITKFREEFIAPEPFNDTMFSYKASVFEDFLKSALVSFKSQILKEIGDSVEKMSWNGDGGNTEFGAYISKGYDKAISDIKSLLQAINEIK